MSLHVEQVVTGSYKQNCHVAVNDDDDALIVDPGSEPNSIIHIITRNSWRPLAVIATHAHFDHVGAVAEVMEHFDIPFYLHKKELSLLRRMNLFKMVVEQGPALRIPEVTHDLAEMKTTVSIGGFTLEVIASPGHTPGGVCLVIEGNIFTGDTILPKGFGRTDLPGGNLQDLESSIEKISRLPCELVAHPGHGPSMQLGSLLISARKIGTTGI